MDPYILSAETYGVLKEGKGFLHRKEQRMISQNVSIIKTDLKESVEIQNTER